MELPHVIQSTDAYAADILHKGDIIGCRYDHDNRSWVQRTIINYQKANEKIEYPACEVSHVAVVSGGKAWTAWEMAPPNGRHVELLKAYSRLQFWVMRYDGWHDDQQRYLFVERAANLATHRYSWTGCIHLATNFFPQLPGGEFCSEQVEDSAEFSGVDKGRGFVLSEPEKTSPARIITSPLLKLIAIVYHKGE